MLTIISSFNNILVIRFTYCLAITAHPVTRNVCANNNNNYVDHHDDTEQFILFGFFSINPERVQLASPNDQ